MNAHDPRDHIADLEERIDALRAKLETCRKLAQAARLSLATGAILLVLNVLTLTWSGPTVLVVGVTAFLLGCVLLGSNASTAAGLQRDLGIAEAQRNQLIDAIGPRDVGRDLGLSLLSRADTARPAPSA